MYVEQTIPLHSVEAETAGVPNAFLTEMLLRHLSRMGELPLFQIAKRMGMSPVQVLPLLVHMRALQLIEVPRRGETEGDVSYALTEGGRNQGALAFERCQYVGPAPVPLWEYVDRVNRQSLRHQPTTVQRLKDAMGTLVLEDDLLPTLGSALNSGKAIYLYGPSGTGKSYLAEHLVKIGRAHV